jgi:hypothetical protein
MSSHALFQAAQIIPINSHISAKKSPKTLPKLPLLRNHRRRLVLRSSYSASPAHIDSDTSSASSLFERCYAAPSPPSASHNVNPVMKGKYGAFGALTLEKSKVEFAQQQSNKSSPEVCDIFTLSFIELGFLVLVLIFILILFQFSSNYLWLN